MRGMFCCALRSGRSLILFLFRSAAAASVLPSPAVDAFRSLSALSSPIDKLQCVVSVAKAICACVDQAKQAQAARQQHASALSPSSSPSAAPAPVVIGADDLLLLFAYLLIHARSGALLAELAFLADFIPEHQRCTMQGYYLATTQAAAELLASDELKHSIAQREGAAAAAPATTTTTTTKEPPTTSDGSADQAALSATSPAESAPEQAAPAAVASSEDAVAAVAVAPAVPDTQAPAADTTSIASSQQEQTLVHDSTASQLN